MTEMNSPKDKCPKCGIGLIINHVPNTYTSFTCGSVAFLRQSEHFKDGFDQSPKCELHALRSEVEQLRKACQSAAKVFREYQQLHLRKGTPEGRSKADANGLHAEMLERVAPYEKLDMVGQTALAETKEKE